ncbi:glycosyltransferase family 1 protein [Flammula alnicola]|nr:glycosyltransferase family 1 protein [Flammula alnicola]
MSTFVSRILSRTKTTSQPEVKKQKQTKRDSASSMPTDDSEDSQAQPQTFPLISQLYDEASEFEKVLLRSGCINPEGVCPKGTTGFLHLVGHDLSTCERAMVNRDAKVCAANRSWVPPAPELDDTSTLSSISQVSSDPSDFVLPTIHRVSTDDSEPIDTLEPKDILGLLAQEFGSLAVEGDEEKLLLETDGCLLHDVAILGVIHLTTHRLTFHASLFATRPDLASSQPIKAGPATLHRKGLRGKRRVWLELSHDMICSYASSKEEDRSHPLCSILLGFINEVYPAEPNRPRVLRLFIDPRAQTANDYAEFDTEESAQEWRREVTGAVFDYRHLRKESYIESSSPDSNGVKLSCPLTQITKLEVIPSIDFSSIVSLTVKLSASDFQFENEVIPESQVFEIGPITHVPLWERLGDIICESKLRQLRFGIQPELPTPVVVDFGPYSFFGGDYGSTKILPQPAGRDEHAIRLALGFSVETDIWIARARIYRTVTCSGYFVISEHHIGFWSKNITQQDVRYRLHVSTINYAKPFNLNWLNVEGIKLGITGNPEAKFVFKSTSMRDEAFKRLKVILNSRPDRTASFDVPLDVEPVPETPTSTDGTLSSYLPQKRDTISILAPLSRTLAAAAAASADLPASARSHLPKVINLPREMLITRKSLHFACLTIGSRGDVQPYIALGLGLKKEGHTVTIITHEEYKDWITGFGLAHRTAGGDPGALMKLSVENKMFSPDFFKESLTNFRPWLDQLLLDSWEACFDADVLLESPSAMAGVHIAEALNIPYFRTFTMPWTKTSEFPHAFLSPPVESPTFNSASNVMWAATSNQINKWRRHTLQIGNTDMGHLAQSKIIFIYNFSKVVVPKPLDWPDTTIISGYWFLDNPDLDWVPPPALLEFMAKARADGKPIIYIGFGSITVPHPNKVTAAIVKAVLLSDVRAIISKGWSARMSKPDVKDVPVKIPPECFLLDKVPHDWLFPRVDAALHHGGAGTTGASLRAGIPTLIKPWFGDQFFWASRVQILGAGLKVPSLRSSDLAHALKKATRDESMKAKAAAVGEQIRSEDGVHTTIHAIYTYLHRASQDRASLDKKL